jgi:hypothetical protein
LQDAAARSSAHQNAAALISTRQHAATRSRTQ